jgi:WLM domain.
MSDIAVGMMLALIITFIIWKVTYESFCSTSECKTGDEDTIRHLKHVLQTVAPDAPEYDIKSGKESVTINKEQIYICLRNPNTSILYPFDVLLYVTLHELAHVFSKTYSTKSHNDEFKTNFSKLLNRAYGKNLLSTNVVVPDDYCKKKDVLDFFTRQIF